MSASCLELLPCGKLLRIYFVIKSCCLPVLLFTSGCISQHLREALQKAEFLLWYCHWHPATSFKLSNFISCLKKMVWGVPFYHPQFSQKCWDLVCMHLRAARVPLSDLGFLVIRCWPGPNMPFCGWPLPDSSHSLYTNFLLPKEQLEEHHSFFSMCLLSANGHWRTDLTWKSWVQRLKKQEARRTNRKWKKGNHEWVTLWLTLWHTGFTPCFEYLWPTWHILKHKRPFQGEK